MGQKQQRTLRLEPEQVERPTVNQPLAFWRIPARKLSMYFGAGCATLEPVLMNVDGKQYFVHYSFYRPTEQDLKNAGCSETQIPFYIEAKTADEALEQFRSKPGTQGPEPALQIDRRSGRRIEAMPPCEEMIRKGGRIFCGIRLKTEEDKEACVCFVQHGWPPPECPIAKAIKFDFDGPPIPYKKPRAQDETPQAPLEPNWPDQQTSEGDFYFDEDTPF